MQRIDIYALIRKLIPKNPWNLIWFAVIAAVVLTALVNYIQSLIWTGYTFRDLLAIGTIDAIIVALVVAPIVIKLGVIEKERIEAELRGMALTDDLTKLNNRRGFFFLAGQFLKVAARTKEGMYLMYTDLNDFKKINDAFGHAEGDRALKAYARLLKENYRESDIIGRIGGDEFVILPVGTSKDGVDVITNRFKMVLSQFNDANEAPWKLSAAYGIAYFDPESPSSLDELLRRADAELYDQKKR